ncbi:MAG: TRAP transporter large permease subunit [bacterium]
MDLTSLSLMSKSLFICVMVFLVLGTGMWISLGLALTGLLVLIFLAGGMQGITASILYQSVDTFVLSAIPLFIFLAAFVMNSGLSNDMYKGISHWTSVLPGGLLQSNIMASAIFSAVCGSSSATSATIGTVAYKDQVERKYNSSLVVGSIAAGGTLGILIPPSTIMIIYGDFVGISVGRLFSAGIIPGIIIASLFMIYIMFYAMIRGVGPLRERLSWGYFRRVWLGFKLVWPILTIIGTIMGGIYSGLMTPTEAAAFSSFIAIIIAIAQKKFSFDLLWKSAITALRTACMILFITVGASFLGQGVSMIKLPSELSVWLVGLGMPKMSIWVGMILFYFVLGCLMEGVSMMLLTLPVTYPILVTSLGFDGVWFGIMLTILIEIAGVTPPVGLNLFILQGVTGLGIGEVSVASFPFFIIMLLALILFTIFPGIVTFIPNLIF